MASIDVPEEYKTNIREVEEMRSISFVKDMDKKEENLNTTAEALDELYTGDIQTLPTDQLVRLVKLSVALCKQNNSQIQSDISFIAQLELRS